MMLLFKGVLFQYGSRVDGADCFKHACLDSGMEFGKNEIRNLNVLLCFQCGLTIAYFSKSGIACSGSSAPNVCALHFGKLRFRLSEHILYTI